MGYVRKGFFSRFAFGCFLSFLFSNYQVSGQPEITTRVALVIGVQNYIHVPALQHSLNDAHDMAAVLKSKGFFVLESYDAPNKKDLQDVIRKYYNLIRQKPGAAGLIFYSGHGIQVDGSNFLIPRDADPQMKADLDDQCVKMDFIMEALEEAGNSLNILIMDACRNNPFRGFSRSADRGLNIVDAPKGSYVVYATKPGSVASDGTGRNGLFTSKLLKYINEPDLNLEQVFKKVARDVSDESSESQRPWIASDYTGDFYFSVQNTSSNVPSSAVVTHTAIAATERSLPKGSGEYDKLSKEELYARAHEFSKSSNFTEATRYYERASELGSAEAQVELADLYYGGKDIPQDYKKAFQWYHRAAGQNPAAQFKVGNMFENGEGVADDYDSAVFWYRKAAMSNHVQAQYNLGIMCLNGRGTPKDELEGVKWLAAAGDLGNIEAQNKLGGIYLMGGDQVSKNKNEAIRWFRKAAAQGDKWAKDTLSSLGVRP